MPENHDCHAACFVCGITNDLQMVAHRNPNGHMVGWIFVCDQHLDDVADEELIPISALRKELTKLQNLIDNLGGAAVSQWQAPTGTWRIVSTKPTPTPQ